MVKFLHGSVRSYEDSYEHIECDTVWSRPLKRMEEIVDPAGDPQPYLKITPCTVIKLVSGSSDAMRHKVIIWTNADVLSDGPLRRNLSNIWIKKKIITKKITKMNFNMSSTRRRPFCHGIKCWKRWNMHNHTMCWGEPGSVFRQNLVQTQLSTFSSHFPTRPEAATKKNVPHCLDPLVYQSINQSINQSIPFGGSVTRLRMIAWLGNWGFLLYWLPVDFCHTTMYITQSARIIFLAIWLWSIFPHVWGAY